MAVITMESLSSCGVSRQEREEKAQRLLTEKYNEQFEIVEVVSQRFGENYYDIVAYPESDPDIRFWASIDTGDDYFSDGYVQRCLCTRLADQIQQNLDEFPGYSYVYVTLPKIQPKVEDKDIRLEDYVKLYDGVMFHIYIHLCPNDMNDSGIFENLMKSLKGMEALDGLLYLYVEDEEMFAKVQSYFEEKVEPDIDYTTLTEDCKIGRYEVQKGVINISEQQFQADLQDR